MRTLRTVRHGLHASELLELHAIAVDALPRRVIPELGRTRHRSKTPGLPTQTLTYLLTYSLTSQEDQTSLA